MHAAAPAPPGHRRGDVVRVGVAAVAEHLAVDGGAACERVLQGLEHTERRRLRRSRSRRVRRRTGATRVPDRRCGCSCAPMRANAETVSGVTGASVAPATTTSALPSRTMRTPSPIAFAPAAHAVEMHSAGPVKPNRMEIMPAAAFGIIIGTKNGLTRLAPRCEERGLVLLHGLEPADAGRRDHRAAAGVGAELAGVAERVGRGAEAELREAVDAAHLLGTEVRLRVVLEDLAGELDGKLGRVEALDPLRGAAARRRSGTTTCRRRRRQASSRPCR